ncbi:hypothetical protein ACTD5D_00005, partial [Nocardia takedensis]
PRYPFTFHQGYVLEFLAGHGHEMPSTVIAASPPCQAMPSGRCTCRAVPDCRADAEALEASGLPVR